MEQTREVRVTIGVYRDTNKDTYRDRGQFDSFEAAVAWLARQAGMVALHQPVPGGPVRIAGTDEYALDVGLEAGPGERDLTGEQVELLRALHSEASEWA